MNLINNLRGGHCFGSSRTRRKSPRLNWATQFLTVASMMHVPLLFLSEWREFSSAPCLAGKNLMTVRVSMLSKSRMSLDMLPFSLCNKKRLAIRHMNRPLVPTNDTIDSVLRHRKVGRAKDLSAPPHRMPKTRRCLFSTASHICFRIRQFVRPRV